MKRVAFLSLLTLSLASTQCIKNELSRPATVTVTSEFMVGSYELVEFSILTEFQQLLTQDDYQSLSGTLEVSPLLFHQTLTIDGVESVLEGPFSLEPDSEGALFGTITIVDPDLPICDDNTLKGCVESIDFAFEGKDLIIHFNGITELEISYVETHRWHKISDEP